MDKHSYLHVLACECETPSSDGPKLLHTAALGLGQRAIRLHNLACSSSLREMHLLVTSALQ